jgi:hypothetical protein
MNPWTDDILGLVRWNEHVSDYFWCRVKVPCGKAYRWIWRKFLRNYNGNRIEFNKSLNMTVGGDCEQFLSNDMNDLVMVGMYYDIKFLRKLYKDSRKAVESVKDKTEDWWENVEWYEACEKVMSHH